MGKIAFLFAGQGSQYTGMGEELSHASQSAARVFSMADAIRPGTSEACFTADKKALSVTAVTQPSVFATDLAAAEALREGGIMPDYIAGFSLGEVPALAFGGYMDYETAFKYVIRRGELMQTASEKAGGKMFAILGIAPEKVEEISATIEDCWPVNYNCNAQTVVSCTNQAAERLPEVFKAAGARAMRLPVGGAFHCKTMDEAAEGLRQEFSDLEFAKPRIPVISNLTAEEYTSKDLMFSQVSSPVRWSLSIEKLIALGVDTFVEVGPGKTLTGLMSKINPACKALRVENADTLKQTMEVITNAQ